ncbi:MAG TPA: alkyl hydroperoxide reductase subunit F [Fibrobacteria bacterium]|nr:alkyl hydroperoxide reductase subunit F [Fibrobacteria bacterium]HOX51977.1 alkyl hydroperoxide reductase subunit F [Fibrobacteria bacterium]
MLDQDLLEQLRQVFQTISGRLTLVQSPSDHAQQEELRGMLQGVSSASENIDWVESGHPSPVPRFAIHKDGSPTGIVFRGIPGGHEFTSLVLAILNADGKGKLPDEGIQQRIKALRGPVRLRTFVSLECTNCPDVVQALNLMAILHDDFQHETWDGALAESEVERLKIQGVPAVFSGDTLLHVGKSDLASLLDTLEEKLGKAESPAGTATTRHEFDLVVVGGGPAGAAAAIYSVRKGLKVGLVAGRIGGQVKDTLGIENLISVPYTEGPKLAQDLRSHLEAAGVLVLENRTVESLEDQDSVKVVHLKGGEEAVASQVILATGAKWRELGVPGEKEHIGRGVAFCPHCDGPFYKGRRVAVIGGGNSGVEAAIDLAGICSEVTLLEFGDALRADAVLQRKLASLPNASVVVSARTTEVVGDGQKVTSIRWEDRTTKEIHQKELDGVFVQIGLAPNSAPFKDILETNRAGEIVVDDRGRTSKAGIYAAGDVTNGPFKQIVIGMGDGAKVALSAFDDRIRGK